MRQTKLGILITSQWQGRGVQEAKRGLGDLEGILIGSVSHKVTSLARCTCIVVK